MNSSTTSEFPKFLDADVEIIVSAIKTYHLHSVILKRKSPFFARSIDAQPNLLAQAKKNGVLPYRFRLTRQNQKDIGTFLGIDVRETGRNARNTSAYIDPEITNGPAADNEHRSWDWLFSSFYGHRPDIEEDDLPTVVNSCVRLADVADTIEAVPQVSPIIELALIQQDDTLWAAIAGSPAAWAELGRRVQSPTIFKEAIVHLVGKWQGMTDEDRHNLSDSLRELCERKWKELDVAKEAIDMRILGHYPAFLCRDHINKPTRPSYSNDIYMWMAISFFRQWYAQAISDGRNRVSPDGGHAFYNALAKGGQAYLHHEDFRNFHQYFPMSSKACSVLESNMGVLKEDMKMFVRDIVQVRVHVKPESFELTWLTCAIVNKEDLPWGEEAVRGRNVPMGRTDLGVGADLQTQSRDGAEEPEVKDEE